jgi:hypothetical protein
MKFFFLSFRKILDLYFLRLIFSKKILLKFYPLIAVGESKRMFRHPLWLTVDVIGYPDFKIKVDDFFEFPFKSNSIKVLYSSHNIEHISHIGVEKLIKEAYRVLKQGGEFLIDLPCSRKAYNMIKIYSENNENITLRDYLSGLEITEFAFEKSLSKIPWNKKFTRENVLHPYNSIINGILASFMDPAYNSPLLPVIHDPTEIDQKIISLSMDDFFKYVSDSVPIELRYTGGHCETWYDDKLANLLRENGFAVSIRYHKQSKLLHGFMVPDRDFERRDKWSFKLSAIKV